MSLKIKNPGARRLAVRLAELTGESLTTAVIEALPERLARAEKTEALAEELLAIGRDCARGLGVARERDYNAWLYDERDLPK